ncbi:MAG: Uma2 family endonuclease [Symploca sp. SIO2E6]|nr:Uma2 family endonuclease [Symploca sp. SIO2E6]
MTPQEILKQQQENLEQVVDPDISHLVIEDDIPIDDFKTEQQQRLLIEPLHSSSPLPKPFLAAAHVGLFYDIKEDPIVPDFMLSLGVKRAADYSLRENRTYLAWKFGKLPDVCIEIVSNQEGDELFLSEQSQQQGKTRTKMDIYEDISIPYFVVFDPFQEIPGKEGMDGALLRVWEITSQGYQELTSNQKFTSGGESVWLEEVGIGLMLWYGAFEGNVKSLWLRWCDQEGQPIPTGAEGAKMLRQRRAEMERQRADTRQQAEIEMERQRVERLAQKLREMGVDPDQI